MPPKCDACGQHISFNFWGHVLRCEGKAAPSREEARRELDKYRQPEATKPPDEFDWPTEIDV